MTPMKRYAKNITELKKLVSTYFTELPLNKSSPKYNPYAYINGGKAQGEGVKNDFISIFNSKHKDISFAFAYAYIDLEPEEQTVTFSIKKGKTNDKIIGSLPMNLEEFRSNLNLLVKELNEIKPAKLSEVVILEKLSAIFMEQEFLFSKEIKEAAKEMKKTEREVSKELNIKELEKDLDNKTNLAQEATVKLIKKVNALPETKRISELEKELKTLKDTLTKKKEKIRAELQIDELVISQGEATRTLQNAQRKVNKKVDEKLNGYSSIAARTVKMR